MQWSGVEQLDEDGPIGRLDLGQAALGRPHFDGLAAAAHAPAFPGAQLDGVGAREAVAVCRLGECAVLAVAKVPLDAVGLSGVVVEQNVEGCLTAGGGGGEIDDGTAAAEAEQQRAPCEQCGKGRSWVHGCSG